MAEPVVYQGRIYVRPLERGICLLDGAADQNFETLDDMLDGEGFWHITIVARKLEGAEKVKAARELH